MDIIHPDLSFAGGFTGTSKIADYAALFRTPVALHNVGSLVLTYANAHFGASIQNFYRSESQLGRPNHYIEEMAPANPPEVRRSLLTVPTGPGLGLEINPDFLKEEPGGRRNLLGVRGRAAITRRSPPNLESPTACPAVAAAADPAPSAC